VQKSSTGILAFASGKKLFIVFPGLYERLNVPQHRNGEARAAPIKASSLSLKPSEITGKRQVTLVPGSLSSPDPSPPTRARLESPLIMAWGRGSVLQKAALASQGNKRRRGGGGGRARTAPLLWGKVSLLRRTVPGGGGTQPTLTARSTPVLVVVRCGWWRVML